MSDETQANLSPEAEASLQALLDPAPWERARQAIAAKEAQQAQDMLELRTLCRRMATRMEDMERRLRRLETDG